MKGVAAGTEPKIGSYTEVCREVSRLITETLSLSAGTVTEQTGLLGQMIEFDSMAVVSILTALEDRYGVRFDDSELSADLFKSVGDLAGFVHGKLRG